MFISRHLCRDIQDVFPCTSNVEMGKNGILNRCGFDSLRLYPVKNIRIADIIIRMTPDVAPYLNDDGVLLASGIILERSEDVISCFEENGFEIADKAIDNGWCALVVRKKK